MKKVPKVSVSQEPVSQTAHTESDAATRSRRVRRSVYATTNLGPNAAGR